ncbi:MAG: hypothetical protein AAGC58_05600, partial [Asticcacaulis sp.]
YMITLVASAKHFNIEPINRMEIPKKSEWNDGAYEDFQNEIDFYAMQLALEGADRNHQLSILLQGNTKDRLLTLVTHMRDQIRKLELSPARIDALLQKLNQFERDLEGPRLNFLAVTTLSLVVAGAIADIGGAATTVRQLLNQVEEAVGLAKEEQDKAAVMLLPQIEVRKLEPPRREIPQELTSHNIDFDLDEEVPF